jgi:hypothetical protein
MASGVTIRVPEQGVLSRLKRAWPGERCPPLHVNQKMLGRMGIAEILAGRPHKDGKDVFTLRTFEYLAAVTIDSNPYTDDWALIQDDHQGGHWIALFDSALDRTAPLFADPSSWARRTARTAKLALKLVHPHFAPVISAVIDLDNLDRVRSLLAREHGSASRIAFAEIATDNGQIRIEQPTRRLLPRIGLDDDIDTQLAAEVEDLRYRAGFLANEVQGAAEDIGGGGLQDLPRRLAERLAGDAVNCWASQRPQDIDPRLRLIAFDGGPQRFARNVLEGR